MLVNINNEIVTYDSNGIRTIKQYNNYKHLYELDGSRIIKETIKSYDEFESPINSNQEIGLTEMEINYIYSSEGIVGFETSRNGVIKRYFYNKNILGDILEIYDNENKELVAKYVYDAYGNHEILVNKDNIANINPFRYRGYYYDVETGLYYCNYRYYSPKLCRWISPDSIEYLEPESIGGLNLYCYCYNNPVMYVDSNGHIPKWLQWILGGLIVVGAIAGLMILSIYAAPVLIPALGSTLAANIIGGAIIGAAGGAVAGFGLSYGFQVIEKGLDIDWNAILKSTASGAISGFIAGGVFGGIKYAYSIKNLSNSVSGLSKAQASLDNALKPLSNVKNLANMPFSGANIVKTVGQTAANYNSAYANLIFASVNNAIAKLAFTSLYSSAQFVLKQSIGYGINQIWRG